jgi:hypothetical protein
VGRDRRILEVAVETDPMKEATASARIRNINPSNMLEASCFFADDASVKQVKELSGAERILKCD